MIFRIPPLFLSDDPIDEKVTSAWYYSIGTYFSDARTWRQSLDFDVQSYNLLPTVTVIYKYYSENNNHFMCFKLHAQQW